SKSPQRAGSKGNASSESGTPSPSSSSSQASPSPSPSKSAWSELATDGHLSARLSTPSPSMSPSALLPMPSPSLSNHSSPSLGKASNGLGSGSLSRFWSHASPIPSSSASLWLGLAVSTQLSAA